MIKNGKLLSSLWHFKGNWCEERAFMVGRETGASVKNRFDGMFVILDDESTKSNQGYLFVIFLPVSRQLKIRS